MRRLPDPRVEREDGPAQAQPRRQPAGELGALRAVSYTHLFDDIRDIHYDGLIITGAPVEQMPFEEVDYWPELCQIMDWSTTHVHSTLHICWGAQAGLYHHYGIRCV